MMDDKKKVILFILILACISVISYLFSNNRTNTSTKSKETDIVETLNKKFVPDIDINDLSIVSEKVIKIKKKKTLIGIRRLNISIPPGMNYIEDILDNKFILNINKSNKESKQDISISIKSNIEYLIIKTEYDLILDKNKNLNKLKIKRKELIEWEE